MNHDSPTRDSSRSNGDLQNNNNYKDNDSNYKDDEDFERKMRSPTNTTSESPPNQSETSNSGNTLHVSNLNPRTRESELRDTFAAFGKIVECIILLDPNTKESRGFGFVTYSTSEEAQDAISRLDSSKIDGNTIRVEKSKRSKPRDPTPGFYMGSERKKRMPYGYGGPPSHHHHHMRGGDPRGAPYGSYPGYPPASFSKYPPPTMTTAPPPPYGGMGYYNYAAPSYPSYPPSYPTYPKYNNDTRYTPYGRRDDGGRGGNGGGGGGDRGSRSSSNIDHDRSDRRSDDRNNRDSRDYYRRD